MNARRILTEDARSEQWRMLLHFSYETNIKRFYDSHGKVHPGSDVIEYIAGSLRQAEAYFSSSHKAPLDIAPLLLYYGTTNLLVSMAALINGKKLGIKNHGMDLRKSNSKLIGDTEVAPISPGNGALGLLCSVFSSSCNFISGVAWTVQEIFASIPDLHQDCVYCYSDLPTHCVPVEIVREGGAILERIRVADCFGYALPFDAIEAIEGFSGSYLRPQLSSDKAFINIRRKLGSDEIGTYSLFGQKFLQIGHKKQGHLQTPTQLIMMLMVLFALGHLSRYYPELWNPFVRVDETGEKMVVERYIAVCDRFVPNLVLNKIYGERLQFENGIVDDPRSHKQYSEEYVKQLIDQRVQAAWNREAS